MTETEYGMRLPAVLIGPASLHELSDVAALFAEPDRRLRFRFLDRPCEAGRHRIVASPDINHARTQDFIGRIGTKVIAAGRLAYDPDGAFAEVSIAVRRAHQRRGVSWRLLEYLTILALDRGARVVRSVTWKSFHDPVRLGGQRQRFAISDYAGEPDLMIVSNRTLRREPAII